MTIIGWRAFSNCSGLTSIFIPNTISEIRWETFSGCTGLTSITIPDSVINISSEAFWGCTGLISIYIPKNVEYIDEDAFRNCTSLRSIEVSPLNLNYSSHDGVLFDKEKATLIQSPAEKSGAFAIPRSVKKIHSRRGWAFFGSSGLSGQGAFEENRNLTEVTLPPGLTRIGSETFRGCESLTSITIPANVLFVGNEGNYEGNLRGAFEDCTNLHSAVFLGNAPFQFDQNTFKNTAPGFTIYYLSCSTGFTSPTWHGYRTVRIDERACPAAPWLLSHGLSYDTDLNKDLNGDGVDLLMAYALDLDPNTNLSSSMPAPVLNGNSLNLTFHAAAPGITYSVETSTDLDNWTTDGVVISNLDIDKQRTASVPLDAPRRYLRLVVSESP